MLFWMIATVLAFFVKGLCGFANTLVFTTILSFMNNNINISPVELMLGYPTNVMIAYKERKSIQWKLCVPVALMVILGSIPGILFLKHVDTGVIKAIFGIVIVLIGLEMLIRERQTHKSKQSKVILAILGILSGLLCGLYGIGALLGAYISRVTDDSSSFKANICIVFFVENTFRLILYAIWGVITLGSFLQALKLSPFMLLGLGLGVGASKILNEKIVKKIVILMLIVSGAAICITSL